MVFIVHACVICLPCVYHACTYVCLHVHAYTYMCFHVQLRMCVMQFQSVSEQYSALYSSLFDADLTTLEYVALYPTTTTIGG